MTEEKIIKIVDDIVHTRGVNVDQIGSKAAMAVNLISADSSNLPGMEVPSSDEIEVSYPDPDTEVYVYKKSGSTVATITVNYVGGQLSSVVKS